MRNLKSINMFGVRKGMTMNNRIFLVLFGLVISALIAGLIGGCGAVTTTKHTYYYYPDWTPNGKIVCVKANVSTTSGSGPTPSVDTDAEYFIILMDSNGSNEVNIKKINQFGKIATSPLGNYYAYTETGTNIIHVITIAGDDYASVNCGANVETLDWGKDETKIVYGTILGEVFIVQKNGVGTRLLSPDAAEITWRWGDRIVFKGHIGSDWGAIIMDANNLTSSLTNTKSKGSEFNISKLNTDEAIYRNSSKIYRVLLNTSEATPELIIESGDLWNIKLSPDGQKIVATGNNIDGVGVWTINIDGSNIQKLINNSLSFPKISSDGRKIVCGDSSDTGIWISNIDGTGLKQIK